MQLQHQLFQIACKYITLPGQNFLHQLLIVVLIPIHTIIQYHKKTQAINNTNKCLLDVTYIRGNPLPLWLAIHWAVVISWQACWTKQPSPDTHPIFLTAENSDVRFWDQLPPALIAHLHPRHTKSYPHLGLLPSRRYTKQRARCLEAVWLQPPETCWPSKVTGTPGTAQSR